MCKLSVVCIHFNDFLFLDSQILARPNTHACCFATIFHFQICNNQKDVEGHSSSSVMTTVVDGRSDRYGDKMDIVYTGLHAMLRLAN